MVIERLSTMIEGKSCALLIDGSSYHKEVKRGERGLYIRLNHNTYYESDLPLGEEVEI